MDNQRKKLIEAYDGLDPLEQSIVQLFSVIYDNVTRTSVLDCLRKSNIRMVNGKAFTHQSFKPLWQKLLKMGLLVETEGRLHCRESISEEITRRAVLYGHFNGMANAVQAAIKLNTSWGYRYYVTYPQMLREIRIAFYSKDLAKTLTLLEECTKSFPRETAYQHPYVAMFSNAFDANWLDGLPETMIGDILARVLDHSLMHFEPATEACAFLEDHWSKQTYPDNLRQMRARQWMLKGKLDRARRLLEPADTTDALALRGSIDFLGGANENALERCERRAGVVGHQTASETPYRSFPADEGKRPPHRRERDTDPSQARRVYKRTQTHRRVAG